MKAFVWIFLLYAHESNTPSKMMNYYNQGRCFGKNWTKRRQMKYENKCMVHSISICVYPDDIESFYRKSKNPWLDIRGLQLISTRKK